MINLDQENRNTKGGYTLELYTQIKKYRTNMNLSQEQLAEKVYVTRQTISNWENNKSYPDIHSLLLLSSIFNISLDQLIKGDIKIMKQEINNAETEKFNKDSAIFTVLLLVGIIVPIPLIIYAELYGLAIVVILYAVMFFYASRVEKFKKKNDIITFKEIVSFTDGKRLDEIEKAVEVGKRPYQQVFLVIVTAAIALVVSMLMMWIFRHRIF